MAARKLSPPAPTKAAGKKPDPITCARALLQDGDATPSAAPDRRALEAYATWLFYERRLVCHELYPGLGVRSDGFVLSIRSVNLFHFDGDGSAWNERPQPSTRAARVLDLLGIDWRSDRLREPDTTFDAYADPANAAPLPLHWPEPDAELLALTGAFHAAHDDYDRTLAADEDDPRLVDISHEEDRLVEEIARRTAATVEGLHAKADVARCLVDLNTARTGPAPFASEKDRLAWSLSEDIRSIPADPRFAPRSLPLPMEAAARAFLAELSAMRSPLSWFRDRIWACCPVGSDHQRTPEEEARYIGLMHEFQTVVGLREEVERIVREEYEAALADHLARQAKPAGEDA